MKNKQYIVTIIMRNGDQFTDYASYNICVTRNDITSDIILGNIMGYYRMSDIAFVYVAENPNYDPKAD